MPYSILSVANAFIYFAKEENTPISPLKLQKLVYIAHGWHLAIFNEPLIDEPIETWQYGPVIPSLYKEFRRFGKDPITDYAQVLVDNILVPVPPPPPSDKDIVDLIRKVWDVYGSLHAYQLANLTHQPETPWYEVSHKGMVINKVIPDKFIKEHYLKKAKAA